MAFHLFSYLLLKGQNWSSPCNCSIKIKLFTGNGWLEADIWVQTTIPHNTYIYLHFPLKGNQKDRHRRDGFPVHCQSDLIFAFICFHVAPERSYFQQFIYSELEGLWGGAEEGGAIRRGKTKREICQTQIKSVKGWFDFVNKIGGKHEHRLFFPPEKGMKAGAYERLSATVRYFIVNAPITIKRAIRILNYEEGGTLPRMHDRDKEANLCTLLASMTYAPQDRHILWAGVPLTLINYRRDSGEAMLD